MVTMTGENANPIKNGFKRGGFSRGLANQIQASTQPSVEQVDSSSADAATGDAKSKSKHSQFTKTNMGESLSSKLHLNDQYSRISKGNSTQFDELWISPSQVRLSYNHKKIQLLVKDFLDEEVGQLQPISVVEKINPENPRQRYNVLYGHNRYLAWKYIYEHPDYAELRNDKAWVDKHRPKVVLSSDMTELKRMVHQMHENVVRDPLSAWDICISTCSYIRQFEMEYQKKRAPSKVLRDDFSIEDNIKKYTTICNLIMQREIDSNLDFVSRFSAYRIESPRTLLAFFNVYDHAVESGIVSNLNQWLDFIESKGFLDEVEARNDTQTSAFLALLFDDYIPTADESVGNAELKRRYEMHKKAKEQAEKEAQGQNESEQIVQEAVQTTTTQQPVQQPPVQQPVQTATQQPVQNPVQQPVQTATQQPVQNPVQQPVQTATQQPVQTPAQPVQQPVVREANISAVEDESTQEEQTVGFVHANNGDQLLELMSSEVKSKIGEHFKELFNSTDEMNVGVFIEQMYQRLGNDFIDAVEQTFY